MTADTLFLGKITTMDPCRPEAEALVSAGGKILYVGTEETARGFCGENTVVRDYRGEYIYPGLIEGHCHPTLAGHRLNGQARLEEGRSLEDYLDGMRDYIRLHPGRKVYQGAGWIEAYCARKPDADQLDAVCGEVPLVLQSADGHSVWMNHRAMERYGIDRAAVRKFGPELVRVNRAGEPTGYVSENPAMEVCRQIPMEKDDVKSYLLAWEEYALARGYTVCVNCGLELEAKESPLAYAELEREGKLRLYTRAYNYVADNTREPEAAMDRIAAMEKEFGGGHFSIRGAKVFLDGVVEAHTGWLLEEYADEPGYYGLKRYTDGDSLYRLIRAADGHGMNVHAHCIGDGAVKMFTDACARAQRETGNMDMRNMAAHLQLAREEEIRRFGEYNIVPLAGLYWVGKGGAIFDQTVSYVGRERAERGYPAKSFLKAGAPVVNHSDYPISSVIGLPTAIYTASARRSPNLETQNPDEALTRREALESMTVNAARMLREEDRFGSLKPGLAANLAVFDRDLLNEELERVPGTACTATVIDGKEEYRKADGKNR